MASQEVTRLRELGKRLEKDGYPTAIIERAAERMEALETLVVHQDQEAQAMGKTIFKIQALVEELRNSPMAKRQAE